MTFQESYAKRAAILKRYLRDGGVAGDKQFNELGMLMVALCLKALEKDARTKGKCIPLRAVLR